MTSQKDKAVGEAVRAIFARRDVVHIHKILKIAATEAWETYDCLRLVGGAMRDLYIGRKVKDLDFATPLTPDMLLEVFHRHSVRVLNIGAAQKHGTIIVEVFGTRIEITTLRRDVATDGRHAKVEFTTDWEEDAARRDFTMNAIYGAPDGTIYDYHNGRRHLWCQRIEFIGDPAARIAEDGLRALRFFRFHAELGWVVLFNGEACAAIRDAMDIKGFEKVSGERVWAELSRILAVDCPYIFFWVVAKMFATKAMREAFGANLKAEQQWTNTTNMFGINDRDLPEGLNEKMVEAGIQQTTKQRTLERLSILLDRDSDHTLTQERFGLSGAERKWLERGLPISSVEEWNSYCQAVRDELGNRELANGEPAIADVSTKAIQRALHTARMQCVYDGYGAYAGYVRAALAWKHIPFPISGYTLREKGMREGERMGFLLNETREWWLNGARVATRDECLNRVEEMEEVRRGDDR